MRAMISKLDSYQYRKRALMRGKYLQNSVATVRIPLKANLTNSHQLSKAFLEKPPHPALAVSLHQTQALNNTAVERWYKTCDNDAPKTPIPTTLTKT
jgi:hypothetical protein